MNVADIVISINGRDAGKRFIVIKTETQTGYSLIADGKSRRYEKPKRKKNKHLKLEDKPGGTLSDKIASGEKVTNNEIKRCLAAYAAENDERYETKGNKEGGMQKCQKTT